MSFVKTKDGTKLYFKSWGSGRPVVLIHGWPLSADSWDDTALTLAEAGFRAIAYDRRGFGRSHQPWNGYDYDTLSDDLGAVLEHTNAKEATIVGFSMGGGEVARYLSRHNGKHVAQAALIASIVPYMQKTSDNPLGVDAETFAGIAQAIKTDRAQFFKTFFPNFFGTTGEHGEVSAEVLEWARAVSMSAGLWPTLACATAFATTDFRPDLSAFKVPTLIVHGSADKIVPIDVSARQAVKGIANAKLIEYDGAGHGLFATHKTRVAKDLLAFLRR